MLLKNITIRTRLMIAISLLLLLLATVAGLSYRGFQSLSAMANELVDRQVRLAFLATRANQHAQSAAKDLLRLLLTTDREARVPMYAAMDKSLTSADQALVQFESMYAMGLVNDNMGELKRVRESYGAAFQQTVELIELSGLPAARAHFETTTEPALDELLRSTDRLAATLQDTMQTEVESLMAKATTAQRAIVVIGMFALLVGALLGLAITRAVARPLERMKRAIMEVQFSGDFSKRVAYRSKDEIGQTAQAFDALMDTLQQATADVNLVVAAVAAGDFSRRVEADLNGDLRIMKDAVNISVDSVETVTQGLGSMMEALYRGDFSATLDADVDGEFKRAVDQATQAMRAMQAMLGDVGQVMTNVSRGDLTGRVSAEGRGDLQRLKENINTSLQAISDAMKAINANTRQVAVASNESSAAIGQISDGAQNQTMAIGQVSTAVRQTSSAVADVSRNTEVASQKSKESVAIVRSGMKKMERMVEVVNGIAANSEKINKITEVIVGIANKTNLLSLNAAIEAARAGEDGKGFSVVAEEVGKLAASSADSTQQITQLAQQAVTETVKAVEVVKEVSADMAQIEHVSQETDSMLGRIASAIEQQSSAVQEINANLTSLDKIAQSNSAAAEEINATVIELSKIADKTRQEVERFQT